MRVWWEGALNDVIPYLIGEDPERIEYLWQSCFRRRFYRGGPATGATVSAIDMALWDIKGKAYGMPVYQLLGGLARTRVRVYGHVTGNTAEEAAKQAKARGARGLTAIRFRAFHRYDAGGHPRIATVILLAAVSVAVTLSQAAEAPPKPVFALHGTVQ